MSAKVEQSSNTGAVTSPSATASGVKISKFATKSGFLIPKNKLSGSLIPIFRGGKKGSSDASNDENEKRVQRKTKWGPDLAQDTAVKKGRALAYQTRVDQITQELRLGKSETRDNQDLLSTSHIQDHSSSDHQLNSQELEVLELERREAIGEILRLNPSYKAPADYKPLLKEANVPIPVTEYASHSFVGLIFGPVNDTHKRLEKETGAKIRVYGTKADTGLEVQVTTTDGSDSHGDYNELHVHVSADTYEKVDAAVGLIELLLTPVSGTPASVSMSSAAIFGDNVNGTAPNQGTPSNDMPSVVVSGSTTQPHVGSGPAAQHNIFPQNGGPWFSVGAMPMIPSSGFAAPANISAQLTTNPSQMAATLFNPSTMLSTFGPRSVVSAGFNPFQQSPSLVPSGPQLPQVLQHPHMPQPLPLGHTAAPRNMFIPVSQPTSIQLNVTTPELLSNHAKATGPAPFITSLPQSSPAANFSDQPPIPAGWSKTPLDNSSMGGNMMPEASAVTVLWGHSPMASHPSGISAAPPPNISPVPQPSASHSAGATMNHPTGVPFFNSISHSQMGMSPSLLPPAVAAPMPFQVPSTSIAPIQPVMPQVLMANSSPNVVPGSTPLLSPVKSTSTVLSVQSGFPISGSGGAISFNSIKPPFMTGLRPQQPSSSDFTFQLHRPQNSEFEVGNRPDIRPTLVHPNQSMLPPQGSQNPFIQPAIHNFRPTPNAHGFSRPNVGSHVMQPRAQTSLNFPGGSLSGLAGPPRPPTSSSTAVPLIQPRNFNVAPPTVNAAGIPRAGGHLQFQQNYLPTPTRPQSFVRPNQQFNSNIPFNRPTFSSSGAQQVYDPFSPTSVSRNPQLNTNGAMMQKQDSDPEYEDLMASVGVK